MYVVKRVIHCVISPYALASFFLSFLSVFLSGCAIIRPPRDGGIRYRGLTQEQVMCAVVLLALHNSLSPERAS